MVQQVHLTRAAEPGQSAARAARIAAIQAAALSRAALGQEAHYRRLPDGRHEISLFDRAAGRLRTWTGATLG